MITFYSAISSLTTSLPVTIYPLTARLGAISPFFLAHIAHRTYPSTTACLLTVCDKKVSSTCNRTYVVIRWSLVAPPLNSRYCALRPTVCLPSLSTSCTRGHVTAAPSCQARLLPMESSSNSSTNCDREIYSSTNFFELGIRTVLWMPCVTYSLPTSDYEGSPWMSNVPPCGGDRQVATLPP